MNNTVLYIDGGFVCAQAYYATGHLETSNHDIVGVTFGFLSRLLYLMRYTGSRNFVFAWDTRESFRRDVYPSYKEKRNADLSQEELEEKRKYYKQVDRLRDEIIPKLGFKNTFSQKGLEADDIIGYLTRISKQPGFIISSDQDLYQLLTDDISMLTPSSKGKTPNIFTAEDFRIKYGISPKDWWKAKALMGCSSDNVKGIPGIGPAYALRYLRKELDKTSNQYRKIKDNWSIVKRNTDLVKLPHKKTKPLVLQKNELSYQKFVQVCEELEFLSFLEGDKAKTWSQLFGGSGKKVKASLNEKRRRKIKR